MPPIENMTEEEYKLLQKLSSMSDEDVDAHFRLIKDEPTITAFFSKRKAWALIFGSIHKTVLWTAGLLGAIALGLDKIKALLAYILQGLLA